MCTQVDISVDFRSVPGLAAAGGRKVRVTDVWSGKALGEHVGRFTMEKVGYHDTALLRLSVA